MVRVLWGKQFTEERQCVIKQRWDRNIIIKLGYASADIYRCDNVSWHRTGCCNSCDSDGSLLESLCIREGCQGIYELVRRFRVRALGEEA
jgi:translation initiation factor 2 gamma subunit (eIF-2gamma)